MVETAEAKQVSRAASSLLFPELEFGVAANGTYPSEDFQRVLARIVFDNEFANAGAKASNSLVVTVRRGSRRPEGAVGFAVRRAATDGGSDARRLLGIRKSRSKLTWTASASAVATVRASSTTSRIPLSSMSDIV